MVTSWSVSRSASESVSLLVGWPVSQLVAWLVCGQLVDKLVGLLCFEKTRMRGLDQLLEMIF